jgi:hypothetical protein
MFYVQNISEKNTDSLHKEVDKLNLLKNKKNRNNIVISFHLEHLKWTNLIKEVK